MANNTVSSLSRRDYKLPAALFMVFSPILVMLILSLISGNDMFMAKPIYNDEIDYWRLLYSIDNCGINFGSTEHLVGYWAPIGPLGSHGLSPIFAWGWYILLFPLTDSGIVIAGLIMLCLALALFCFIAKPSAQQMLLIGLLTMLFPQLVRYIYLSMMEMPCYAGCIVYAALLWRYEKERSAKLPKSRWVLPMLLLCGIYCSFLRMSNVVLFFPLILIACDNKISWKLLAMLLFYAAGVIAFNWFFSLFVAPYPDALYTLMQSEDLSQLIHGLINNTLTNIRNFLDPSSDKSLPQAMARYMYLACLLFLAAMCIFKVQDKKLRFCWRWPYFGIFGAGAGNLALVLLIYFVFDWRDYRTLAPLAYFMLLWLILRWHEEGKGFKLGLSILLAFSLLMAPEAYKHGANDPRFYPDESTGLDYSQLFSEEPCTLGIYGYDYPLSLAKDLPPQVGVCIGIFEEDTKGYGMGYILSRPGDPVPSSEYYSYLAPMDGYGELYVKKNQG